MVYLLIYFLRKEKINFLGSGLTIFRVIFALNKQWNILKMPWDKQRLWSGLWNFQYTKDKRILRSLMVSTTGEGIFTI